MREAGPTPEQVQVKPTEFYPVPLQRPKEGERMRALRAEMQAKYRQFVVKAQITAEQDAQLRELLLWVQQQQSVGDVDPAYTETVMTVAKYRGTKLANSAEAKQREERAIEQWREAQLEQEQRHTALYEEFYQRMGEILTNDAHRLAFALAVDPLMWTFADPLGP